MCCMLAIDIYVFYCVLPQDKSYSPECVHPCCFHLVKGILIYTCQHPSRSEFILNSAGILHHARLRYYCVCVHLNKFNPESKQNMKKYGCEWWSKRRISHFSKSSRSWILLLFLHSFPFHCVCAINFVRSTAVWIDLIRSASGCCLIHFAHNERAHKKMQNVFFRPRHLPRSICAVISGTACIDFRLSTIANIFRMVLIWCVFVFFLFLNLFISEKFLFCFGNFHIHSTIGTCSFA